MKLKIPSPSAKELLSISVVEGYRLHHTISQDYKNKRATSHSSPIDLIYRRLIVDWMNKAISSLGSIFPSELEIFQFRNAPSAGGAAHGMNADYGDLMGAMLGRINALSEINEQKMQKYTDLPDDLEIYINGIGSFAKVRDVHPRQVDQLLDAEGHSRNRSRILKTGLGKYFRYPGTKKTGVVKLTTFQRRI